MSDVQASSSAAPPSSLPGSERSDYRGKCLYKTGKCTNERALKTSGTAHNLCDDHRNKQNEHQRKLDAKHREHKRERRASAPSATKSERFAPYPPTAKRPTSVDTSGAAASPPAAAQAVSSVEEGEATPSPSPVLATTSSGVMYLPNGPQPPYSFLMQDFDGVVVPLPSYLEGQERIEFRSCIYQKVLDFISEECVVRYGAKVETASADAPVAVATAQVNSNETEDEAEMSPEENDPSSSEGDHDNDAQQPGTDEKRAKVH